MVTQNKIMAFVPLGILVIVMTLMVTTSSVNFAEELAAIWTSPVKITAFCMLCLALSILVLGALEMIFKFRWTCAKLGWHDGKGGSTEDHYNDGCSNHSVCSKCGKEVMQDSQGNWF